MSSVLAVSTNLEAVRCTPIEFLIQANVTGIDGWIVLCQKDGFMGHAAAHPLSDIAKPSHSFHTLVDNKEPCSLECRLIVS